MTPEEAFKSFRNSIESVNVIVETYNDETLGNIQVTLNYLFLWSKAYRLLMSKRNPKYLTKDSQSTFIFLGKPRNWQCWFRFWSSCLGFHFGRFRSHVRKQVWFNERKIDEKILGKQLLAPSPSKMGKAWPYKQPLQKTRKAYRLGQRFLLIYHATYDHSFWCHYKQGTRNLLANHRCFKT